MSARIATESLRDLRDALDFAEHDLANGEPGAAHAVRYNRRELESMAHGIACDLLDARDELASAQSHLTHALDDAATQRARAEAAEAEVARLQREPAAYKRERDAALARESAMAVLRDGLAMERDHYRERAQTLRARFDWAQHVAAEAMREGLACAEWQRLCLASERARGDAARRAATLAETERDTLRALTDSMRADNVRLRGIVESVRSARAVSAAAAERYTAAWDAVGTMPPTPAQSEEIAAALLAAYEAGDALTAALDAAREGR